MASETGGKDLPDLVVNVTSALMRNKVQRKFNLSGTNGKTKLGETNLLKTIISELYIYIHVMYCTSDCMNSPPYTLMQGNELHTHKLGSLITCHFIMMFTAFAK